jgi:iron complex outermembrane receptor protein
MASRSRFRSHLSRTPAPLAAAALLALAGAARAQAPDQAAAASGATAPLPMQTVQVTARGEAATSDLTGFSAPLARTPIQASVFDMQVFNDMGALTLQDLTRMDASVTDSYNATGYWSTFAIRGFPVDNRYNFRRDGLPINAETVLSLDNKSNVEVLKGLSGMQAGTSAPGGIVNLVLKRPDADLRSATVYWEQEGTVGALVDLSQRFGDERQFGARVNVSAAHLDPYVRDAKGHRQTASIATDWRPDADHVLEFEFEHNLQNEPSVPGFSMLGPVLPDPHSVDPRLNLNDQPWSLPVVTQGNTMSVRYTQHLDPDWSFRVQALQQQLVSNDRLAFPYGLYDPNTFACDPCDRYSSDGHFTIWDFRSEDERRKTSDLDASLTGQFATGPARHALTIGALESIFTARFQNEVYNIAGIGTIDGKTVVPPSPEPTTPNVNRTERSTELYARDEIQFPGDFAAWLGVRHSELHRSSFETSTGTPDDNTDYRQSFTTPWVALSHQLTGQDMIYVSWGEGVESNVAPTMGTDTNRGQPLSATISRQWEAGYKHGNGTVRWGVDVFDTKQAFDTDVTNADGTTTFAHDGNTRSRGIEAEAQDRFDALTLRASVLLQRVRREDSIDPANDGLRPTNVPDSSLALLAAYAFSGVPGLSVLANTNYEGDREVLPDNSVHIPAWTRFDLGARYTQNLGAATTLVWRVGVDNLFDRRAWREAPYQYSHVYLYPLEPRTFHASLEANF